MDWLCLIHRWTMMVLLLLLLLIPPATISSFDCPEGCGVCHTNPNGLYEIDCKTGQNTIFKLQIKPNSYIQLDCQLESHTNWSDLNLGKTIPLEGINSLSFNYCDLPIDNKLETISRQLLKDNVEIFQFKSFKNLSSTLKRDHLRGFNGIKNLTLSSNNLMELPEDLIQDLINLQTLDLRENNISYLPVNFLSPNLRDLDISNNRIGLLAVETFKKLEKLIVLNIFNNNIVKILPHTFDNLVSLENLDLHCNYLDNLPFDVFSRLANLKIINLSENNFTLKSLTNKLFRKNSKLETLSLIENKRNMTSLPDKLFANLTRLTILDLSKNGFIYLPENLFWGSKNLSHITLEGNYLSTLPKYIFRDSLYLRTLNLRFNHLNSLPDKVFLSLHRLKKLDLSGNHIKSISKILFASLVSLKELNMERNGLTTIHFLAFHFAKKLRIAKFSYNELTLRSGDYQESSPFQSCFDLEVLNLDHNNIDTVYQDWNINLNSLRVLNVTYNRIQSLMVSDLQFLSATAINHVEVDYSYNNITYIDMNHAELLFTEDRKKDWLTISIENNPLRCDCSLYDILCFLENRVSENVWNAFHLKIGDLKCLTPEDYRGISISQLKSTKLVCEINSPGLPEGIFCPDKCECYLRPDDKAILTNCANKALTKAPEKIGSYLSHYNELNLSGNLLTEMPDFNLPGYEYVRSINLEHNRISSLPAKKLSNNLKVLKLNNNNLTRMNIELIDMFKSSSSLTKLTLEGNPWICDCETRNFLKFIQTNGTILSDLLKITCHNSDKPISDMTHKEICLYEIEWIIGSCIFVAIIGILIGILVAIYYRYQREIKIWLYSRQWCLNFVTEEEPDKDKRYDAFISCSHNDEEFVSNNILAKLEEGPRPFKLCINYRDFYPGEYILKQTVRSIKESKRTIIVLSPNFLDSIWGRTELREAHKQALNEVKSRVIVILYGDIGSIENLDTELKTYLSMNTYVKWGDPWFWEKLIYALPHKPTAAMISRDRERTNTLETTEPSIDTVNDTNRTNIVETTESHIDTINDANRTDIVETTEPRIDTINNTIRADIVVETTEPRIDTVNDINRTNVFETTEPCFDAVDDTNELINMTSFQATNSSFDAIKSDAL